MHLSIAVAELQAATATAAAVCPANPSHPILAGILLETPANSSGDSWLRVAAYDGATSVKIETAADITRRGSAVVSGKLLAAVAKVLPRKGIATLLAEQSLLTVQVGNSEFRLPLLAEGEYPQLPAADEQQLAFVAREPFAEAVRAVAAAAGSKTGDQLLGAVHLFASAGLLELVATDRARMHYRQLCYDGPEVSAVVLASDLTGSLAAFTDDSLMLQFGSSLAISDNHVQRLIPCLDVAGLPWRQLLDRPSIGSATFDSAGTEQLLTALAAADVVAADSNIRLEPSDSGTVAVIAAAETGRYRDEIAAELAGTCPPVHLSAAKLAAGIAALGSDQLVLAWTGESYRAPLIGNPGGDAQFVLTPMKATEQ